jgi:hypothetical protein
VAHQVGGPLGVLDVGLAPRHVLDVMGVGDNQVEVPLPYFREPVVRARAQGISYEVTSRRGAGRRPDGRHLNAMTRGQSQGWVRPSERLKQPHSHISAR